MQALFSLFVENLQSYNRSRVKYLVILDEADKKYILPNFRNEKEFLAFGTFRRDWKTPDFYDEDSFNTLLELG